IIALLIYLVFTGVIGSFVTYLKSYHRSYNVFRLPGQVVTPPYALPGLSHVFLILFRTEKYLRDLQKDHRGLYHFLRFSHFTMSSQERELNCFRTAKRIYSHRRVCWILSEFSLVSKQMIAKYSIMKISPHPKP
ncbi:hypothetical protein CSPAE12_04835, partial [Colletotrichum incanum]